MSYESSLEEWKAEQKWALMDMEEEEEQWKAQQLDPYRAVCVGFWFADNCSLDDPCPF